MFHTCDRLDSASRMRFAARGRALCQPEGAAKPRAAGPAASQQAGETEREARFAANAQRFGVSETNQCASRQKSDRLALRQKQTDFSPE
ncbi:hypothetical protein OKW45_001473 [Paraburkholderia sp. WSM4175]